MELNEFLSLLKNVQGRNSQYTARCPAHDDKRNSLAISEDNRGIGIYCHAGCDNAGVLRAMGLSTSDLFKKPKGNRQADKKEIDKVYDYVDLHGNVIHSTVRYKNPKGFSQRRPSPNRHGEYIYNLKDIKTVVYNLPAIEVAIKGEKPIFIVEGEKDCHTLMNLGFTATTSPMGAGKWQAYYSDYLVGADVFIIPDNDDTGKAHAEIVAKSLKGKAKSTKIISLTDEIPELPEHGDISDFVVILKNRGSREDIKSRILRMMERTTVFTETVARQENTGDTVHQNPISVINNSYYMARGKEGKAISNFIMKPLELIECTDGGIYTIRFTTESGKYIDKQVGSNVFSGARQFKQMLKRDSMELSYIGSDVELEYIQNLMIRNYPNHPRKHGIDYTGLVKKSEEWLYVDKNGAIDSRGNIRADIMSVIPDNKILDSNLFHAELISRDELKRLSPAMFHFNTYQRTIPIICWVVACFIKERLAGRKIKYSHLEIFGQKGDGKSETNDCIIQPIFGMKGKSIACKGMTNFSLMKTCHCTNMIPVIMEEFKPSFLSKTEISLISNTLRSTYDGHAGQRGRADQSIVNYIKRSPMIIIGEASVDEPAIKERCVEVQFGKTDRTKHHTEQFKFLSANEGLLNKLGRSILNLVLRLSESELDDLINKSRIFNGYDYESRVNQGLNNLNLGLLILEKLFQYHGMNLYDSAGMSRETAVKSIIENVEMSLDSNGKVKSAIEITIEIFDTMALKNRLRNGEHYFIDVATNEIRLRLNLIYDEYTKYVGEHRIEGVEILTIRQFTKQLKNTPYIKFGNSVNRDFTVDAIGSHAMPYTVTSKCWILHLDKANQHMDLEAFYYNTDIVGKRQSFEEFTTVLPDDIPFI